MEKHVIRQRLLLQRKQLTKSVCQGLSLRIQQTLLTAECFSDADTLVLYSPVNNEVRTDQLFATARSEGKRICYPRVNGETLQFVTINSGNELVPGAFGVAEPTGGSVLPASEIDLILVPGVAFDRDGYRLGYGKGFYDRELSRMSCISVGLSYDFQLCESLPIELHDQRLDYVVTESQLIPCRKEASGSP